MSIITKLNVLYVGWGERWHLGTLAQAGRDLVFEYSQEAMARAAARAFQLSPLHQPIPKADAAGASTFTGPAHSHGLPGFIADALPDGWGMLLMDRAFRKAGREPATVSVLERLAVVGHSGIGALVFEPSHEVEAQALDALSLRALAKETQTVLSDDANASSQEQLNKLLLLGGSPQGARPKALLRYSVSQDKFYADDDQRRANTEPWLVKFPAQNEKPQVCALEEFYARLARAGGIDMPPSRFIALGKHAAFGVQRFDRARRGPTEVRVPVLSMAALLQADYRLPSLDYETILLATQRITGDYREVLKAFERCVFNVLTHNRDDHAKNFAFVMGADDRWRLSPAFDLTFSQGPGGEHSTSVAGEGRWPTREHLMRVARGGGVKEKDAQSVLAHWLDALRPQSDLLYGLGISGRNLDAMTGALKAVWSHI